MAEINPSIVLEDSKANRYFFYYKDSSIYYREISSAGDTKDIILISQVNGDFAAAIDADDTVYLTCNSRYKGILLFIYANNGWKFETVVGMNNSSSIYVMDMIVQNGSIHIFFSKKLPIANMYNVYHIHRNIGEQTSNNDYSWRKNSLSEIYSQNIETSYSLLPLKNGIIHYASVWYDGMYYYINYYCYDDSIKSWIHKSLSIAYKNQAFIKLILHNKKINLLCFSNENGANSIHHFLSKSPGGNEIDFKELNNVRIDTNGVIPLFYSDDKAMQLAWIKDHVFHQYTFDDSSGKWKKAIDMTVTAESNILALKVIRYSGQLLITKGYFLLDKNFDILKPADYMSRNASEDKTKGTHQTEAVPDTNDYLKQILSEIRGLSDNVQFLNTRIDNLESKAFVQKIQEEDQNHLSPSKPKTAIRNDIDYPELKKSSFKEKFMKSGRTPGFESLLMNQENITTYVGKPEAKTPSADPSQGIKDNMDTAGNEKQAFVAPGGTAAKKSTINEKLSNGENQYKNNSLLKKIEEYFSK